MFQIPLFGGWRRVWEGDPGARTAGMAADRLAQERNSLPLAIGDSSVLGEFADSLRGFRALWESEAVPSAGGELAFYRGYVAHLAELWPLIDACRWTRWFQLEGALADAASGSDFLTCALVLRTQIDELAVLMELQKWDGLLEDLGAREPGEVKDSLQLLADLLWQRVLPHLRVPRPEEMSRRAPMVPVEPPQALRRWRSFLNDYVHPNYGSHEAAARPEESQVGRVLLEAFSEIYRTFLTLKALPVASRHDDAAAAASGTALQEWETFVSRTLPDIDARMRTRGYPEDWLPAPTSAFGDRIRREREAEAGVESAEHEGDVVAEILKEQASQLRALFERLVPSEREASAREVFRFPVHHPEFGLPVGIAWLHLLPAVRTRSAQLDAVVEQLDPSALFPSSPPYASWIRFVRLSIELSILLSQLKTEAMRTAAVRMLNRRNPLGAVLCARSLLEHYAVGLYLAEQVLDHWKSIEEAVRSNHPMKPRLDALEHDVARYLSGTKATAELSRRWRERWERLAPGQYMAIETPIQRAFSDEDPRRFLYGFFSRRCPARRRTSGGLLTHHATSLPPLTTSS